MGTRILPTPAAVNFVEGSPYRGTFHNGATLHQRMPCLVTRAPNPRMGANPRSPVVCSEERDRKGIWNDLAALRGPIEARFLQPIYPGKSIAPYRVLGRSEGIVPALPEGTVLSAKQAEDRDFGDLAKWLTASKKLWAKHGSGRAIFKQHIDHHGKRSGQFPTPALCVVFSKAGILQSACVLRDQTGIIDHKLYWARIGTEAEAFYLTAVLNSEAVRIRIAHLQARGEQGARDFDKLMFTLPIPQFGAADPVHGELAESGQAAEAVAAAVAITEGASILPTRWLVRAALLDDGITAHIDALLGPDPLRENEGHGDDMETEDALAADA